jgi:hypothetical protein
MNRIKKEFRKKGFLIEEDYPYMPYDGTEAISIDSIEGTYNIYDDRLGTVSYIMNRNGTVIAREREEDDLWKFF